MKTIQDYLFLGPFCVLLVLLSHIFLFRINDCRASTNELVQGKMFTCLWYDFECSLLNGQHTQSHLHYCFSHCNYYFHLLHCLYQEDMLFSLTRQHLRSVSCLLSRLYAPHFLMRTVEK